MKQLDIIENDLEAALRERSEMEESLLRFSEKDYAAIDDRISKLRRELTKAKQAKTKLQLTAKSKQPKPVRTDPVIHSERGRRKRKKVSSESTVVAGAGKWVVHNKEYHSSRAAAEDCGVSQTTIVKWCKGYTKKGKPVLPKKGCWVNS